MQLYPFRAQLVVGHWIGN